MKKLWLTLIIMLLPMMAIAQVEPNLTDQEKLDLRELLTKKTALVNMADTVNLEKIPLQIKQKKDAIAAVISQRDIDMAAEDTKADAAKQAIFDTAQIQINQLKADISSLEAQIP